MRRVFFSFHYDQDVQRAAVVRNSQRFLPYSEWQFLDAADWEQLRRTDEGTIKRWISNQLNGTSVTVVLIGAYTSSRRWVQYEIDQSERLGKGLLGIYIDGIKNLKGELDRPGANPLPSKYQTKRWVSGSSEHQIGGWLDQAARSAGYP